MNKFFWSKTIVFFTIIAMALFFGCSKKSTDANDDQQTEEEQIQSSAEAVDYSAAYIENVTTPSSALVSATSLSALEGALNKNSSTLGDTLFTGCPTAVYNILQKQLLLDYGSGCNGAGGITHSGSIVLTGSFTDGKLTFSTTFNQYTANDYLVNGSISFYAGIDSIEINIENGTIAHGDTSATMDGQLKLVINTNETPSNPLDDVYLVYGYGVITPPNSKAYSFKIVSPLEYHATCEYPVTGIIELDNETYTSSIDFSPNDGQCDDIVKITVGKLSQVVSLSSL